MLLDICLHKGTLRHDLQAGGANLIQRALDQFRSDAFALEFFWNLGVKT